MNVAVLLPVYHNDRADWFGQALNSIISQKGNNFNIRIYLGIDGQITKALEEVVIAYSNYLYKVLTNEVNCGLPVILNKLINALEDEVYVFRMDSDDICCSNRFSLQVQFMEENPSIGIVGTSIIEIDENNKKIGERYYYSDPSIVRKNLYRSTAMAHPTVCFRRDALSLLNKYREDLKISEDLEMWFRAASLNINMANLSSVLLEFRLTNSTIKRRGKEKAWAEFKLYWYGSIKLFGFSWRQLFPLLRLLARLMPVGLISHFYRSDLRAKILSIK